MTRDEANAAIQQQKQAIEDAKARMALAGMRSAFLEGKERDTEARKFAEARRDFELAAYASGALHGALHVIRSHEQAAEFEARKAALEALEAEAAQFEGGGNSPFAKRAARAAEREWQSMVAEARDGLKHPPEAPHKDVDPADPEGWPRELRERATEHTQGILVREGLRSSKASGSLAGALARGEEGAA